MGPTQVTQGGTIALPTWTVTAKGVRLWSALHEWFDFFQLRLGPLQRCRFLEHFLLELEIVLAYGGRMPTFQDLLIHALAALDP